MTRGLGLRLGLLSLGLVWPLDLGAQEWRLREVYQETESPVLRDLVQPVASEDPALTAPLPSLGTKPAFYTFAWLREMIDWPKNAAIVSRGVVFLPGVGVGPAETGYVTALLQFLSEQRENSEASFYLEGLDPPRTLPADPEFRIQGGSKKFGIYSGRTQIQVHERGGDWSRAGSFGVTIRAILPLPTLARDIKNHEQIQKDDIVWRQKEIAAVTGTLPTDEDFSQRLEAMRHLFKDEPLREGSYKVLLPVNQWEQVNVQVTKGTIAIEVVGQALASGRLGQIVKVKIGANKVLDAEVTGLKELRAELP